MALSSDFWLGRRVLLTGHTGFKGGWLSLWLTQMGAQVYGFALPAATTPSFWQVAGLDELIDGTFADIADSAALRTALQHFKPEVVLHLAAQALVRESYRNPAQTYATNVMGTVNLLEAVRQCPTVKAVVVVSTDKCYDNLGTSRPYREEDALGGFDPYSNSKACVELLCASYRDSFLRTCGVALATARAGNVVGGGDWSAERLVPDVLRAWQHGEQVNLRYPQAIRPWQHVLEPLAGYLLLVQALVEQGQAYAEAWNFGPRSNGVGTVESVVSRLAEMYSQDARWSAEVSTQPHEAHSLALDSAKAYERLGWSTQWSLDESLKRTLDWQLAWQQGRNMRTFSCEQIAAYQGVTL